MCVHLYGYCKVSDEQSSHAQLGEFKERKRKIILVPISAQLWPGASPTWKINTKCQKLHGQALGGARSGEPKCGVEFIDDDLHRKEVWGLWKN